MAPGTEKRLGILLQLICGVCAVAGCYTKAEVLRYAEAPPCCEATMLVSDLGEDGIRVPRRLGLAYYGTLAGFLITLTVAAALSGRRPPR